MDERERERKRVLRSMIKRCEIESFGLGHFLACAL